MNCAHRSFLHRLNPRFPFSRACAGGTTGAGGAGDDATFSTPVVSVGFFFVFVKKEWMLDCFSSLTRCLVNRLFVDSSDVAV